MAWNTMVAETQSPGLGRVGCHGNAQLPSDLLVTVSVWVGVGGRPGSWLADPSPTKVQSKHFAGSALPLPPAWARGDLGVNEN